MINNQKCMFKLSRKSQLTYFYVYSKISNYSSCFECKSIFSQQHPDVASRRNLQARCPNVASYLFSLYRPDAAAATAIILCLPDPPLYFSYYIHLP